MKVDAIIQEIGSTKGPLDKFKLKKVDAFEVPCDLVCINDITFANIVLKFDKDLVNCYIYCKKSLGDSQKGFIPVNDIKTFKIYDLKEFNNAII